MLGRRSGPRRQPSCVCGGERLGVASWSLPTVPGLGTGCVVTSSGQVSHRPRRSQRARFAATRSTLVLPTLPFAHVTIGAHQAGSSAAPWRCYASSGPFRAGGVNQEGAIGQWRGRDMVFTAKFAVPRKPGRFEGRLVSLGSRFAGTPRRARNRYKCPWTTGQQPPDTAVDTQR